MDVTARRAVVAASTVATLAVVVLASTLGTATPAGASPAPAPAPGHGLSPEVAALPATSRTLDAAQADLDRAGATLSRDRRDLDRSTTELESVGLELTGVTGLAARRAAQVAKAGEGLERARTDLRAVATEWFVTGLGQMRTLDPSLSAAQLEEIGRQQVLAETVAAGTVATTRFATRRLHDLRAQVDRLEERRRTLGARATALTGAVRRLTASVAADTTAVDAARNRVEVAKLNATIDGTDLPTVALDAYWRAANDLRMLNPRCGMSWWALAGIGRTESRHGTYLGAEPGVDGRVTPPILGPELDGTNGFTSVRDSDGGALDGTSSTDRAVGPMQFLPSTWRTVGRDATGDGVADPQNLYDAALGAGVYLCRSGSVSDEAGLRRAYFSYNRSTPYVDTVIGFADGYRDAVRLPSTG
jgi:membrane-bound lytic murein transglycosylase B